MKKTFLTLAALVVASSVSMAQFVETTTSVTYSGNSVPASGAVPGFYSYQDRNGTSFTEGTCTTPFTATLGGFDNVYTGPGNTSPVYVRDATSVSPARAAGVIFYGGSIANLYYGSPCAGHAPSFGFNVTGVDLSLAANQKISFNYQSDAALALALQVKDQYYNTMLSSVPINIIGDGAVHTISINFSTNILGTADLTSIRQVSLTYPSGAVSSAFGFSISNIKVGSAVTTGVTDSEGVLVGANLFPNPSNGLTTITAELPSSSAVKVSLMDMYGREVKVITEGNFNSINTTFDVSDLAKGIYTVNYLVNGKATKVQKLVVR